MTSHRPPETPDSDARIQALDERLDAFPRRSGGGYEEPDRAAEAAGETPIEWIRLHELLRMPDVAVPSHFAEGVMARIHASGAQHVRGEAVGRHRVSRWSLVAAVTGAVALVTLMVGLGSEAGPQSILQTVLGGFATAALAGAGLVGATWTGVGATVGAWLGTSATAGASLALAALASAGALAWSLRRRAARQRD